MTYTYADIRHALDASDSGRITVSLTPRDAAWDPASTTRVFHGPATVEYVEYADGGIDAHVTPIPA